MLFRNNNGEVFDEKSYLFCNDCADCKECPIYIQLKSDDLIDSDSDFDTEDCDEYILINPEKAALLMGHELIKEKPRLCEVLNVNICEIFYFEDDLTKKFYINNNGSLVDENGQLSNDILLLQKMINNPDKIIKKSNALKDQKEKLKAIKFLFPNADSFNINNEAIFICDDGHVLAKINENIFPFVQCGLYYIEDLLE